MLWKGALHGLELEYQLLTFVKHKLMMIEVSITHFIIGKQNKINVISFFLINYSKHLYCYFFFFFFSY